jgi:hypothetical protein
MKRNLNTSQLCHSTGRGNLKGGRSGGRRKEKMAAMLRVKSGAIYR